jgi:hypothetical protein
MRERREEEKNMKGIIERKSCSIYTNIHRKRIGVRLGVSAQWNDKF